MNENELGRSLARRLDDTVAELDPRITARLAVAREAALERLRERDGAVAVLAGAGTAAAARLGAPQRHAAPRLLLPALVLVAGLIGIYAWQASNTPPDPEEAELIELLSDDLPLNAYVDKGFHQWISPALQR